MITGVFFQIFSGWLFLICVNLCESVNKTAFNKFNHITTLCTL
jgi:hypothetical protein